MSPSLMSPSSSGALFASSAFLAAAALLAPVELFYRASDAACAQDALRALYALSPLDRWCLLACGAAAAVSVAHLVLLAQLSTLSAKRVANLLRASGAALVLVALAAALLVGIVALERERESVWTRTRAFQYREDMFETRVNDVYCHIKGAQVCELGSLAEAKEVFPLQSWPVGMASQPGKSIRSSCDGFDDSVRQWGYPVKMELCRVCHAITKEEQRGGEELVRAVENISLQELQWCGAYLVQDERAASNTAPELRRDDVDDNLAARSDPQRSPYRKHRREFQAMLLSSRPSFSLPLGVQSLEAVVLCAVASLLALFRPLAAAARLAAGSPGKPLV
ncbi:hypothetical protein PybrP1_012359 [[Pythium] brassicae (nom. inval.)]|nr:hypothetical protein PybrP1_012359 [[Pythium] brassicae (nom. inval.)]